MSLRDRLRALFGASPRPDQAAPPGPAPTPKVRPPRPAPPGAPTLAEMRGKLRAGMTRDEFFGVLDDIVADRGLRISLPTADERLVAFAVAEGGELLCFLPQGTLDYVEYQGDIFLERAQSG